MIPILIFSAVAIATILAAYAIYMSSIGAMVKLLVLPALIIIVSTLSAAYIYQLGKPVPFAPKGEWTYVHHIAIGDQIEIWTQKDGQSRLYTIGNDSDARKQLDGAKEQAADGIAMTGTITQSGDNGKISDGVKMTLPTSEPKHAHMQRQGLQARSTYASIQKVPQTLRRKALRNLYEHNEALRAVGTTA